MILQQPRSVFWFSVHATCVISGVRYRAGVCYPLGGDLQAAVEAMQARGEARIYPAEVRFVSGVAYPVAKPQAAPAAKTPPEPAPAVSRKGKQLKR
jgi:hypothetical protein